MPLPGHSAAGAGRANEGARAPLPEARADRLREALRRLVRLYETISSWNRNPQAGTLSPGLLRRVHEGLSPTFRLVPVLSPLLAEQVERLDRLTDMQDRILRGLTDHPRALVSGPAGSAWTSRKAFANSLLGKNLLVRACPARLTEGERGGRTAATTRRGG